MQAKRKRGYVTLGVLAILTPSLVLYLSSTQASQTINDQWVHSFMAAVNEQRTAQGLSPLVENASLDQWAQTRFEVMAQHPDITHYGWQHGGEVYFFPSGFSPDNFANDIKTHGPLHWQILTSRQFSSFGYRLGTGRVYEFDQSCPVYETPGPGINETQYLQAHGCSASVTTDTWLVIELG